MVEQKYKIGYSDIGGVFIGRDIRSVFHKHHSLAIVLSYGEPFEITTENSQPDSYEAALIPRDISYKLSTGKNDCTVFIHLDPYSEMCIAFTKNIKEIRKLNRTDFLPVLKDFKEWFEGANSSSRIIYSLLRKAAETLPKTDIAPEEIDDRILKSIRFIRKSDMEELRLQQAADHVCLSPSRLYHLFKKEIGVTFRQFVQHCKLIKALQSIHNQQNLTEASFFGGFSDQPHFNKTFKKAFGIKPSLIRQ